MLKGVPASWGGLVAVCRTQLCKEEFLRQSTMMFLASLMGCIFSYLYQIYVARALGPAGYGAFGSLFAIFYLISIFSGTVQAGAARFVSKLTAMGEDERIGSFLYGLIKKSILLGAAGFVLFCLISSGIASFLQMASTLDVVVLGTVILLSFIQPAASGVLQGLQRFGLLAFTSVLSTGLKLAFGIILVSLGYGVAGAMGAVTLSTLAVFLFVLFSLRSYLGRSKKNGYDFRELYIYSAPTLLVMLCLAVPSNVDVIMAKHFFSSHEAGLYTAASVVGKMVLFLPGAIASVMFPKASEMKTLRMSTWRLLNRSLLLTGVLSGGAALMFVLFPGLMAMIFGEGFRQAGEVQAFYALMMALFALTWVVAQYCLATGDMKYVYLLGGFSGAEMIMVSAYHASIVQMVQLLAAANLILFLASYVYVFSRRKSR